VIADRRGEVDRAVRLYARVTSGPRAVMAQVRAYRLELDRGHALAAAHLLDEFVANAPEFRVPATAARAQILADAGRGADALALLARAAKVYPDREEINYARASVLEHSGDMEAAIAELRGVAHARPEDPAAQNALGFTLADHGRDLAEAEQRIRAALAERPDSPAIRDSLGWVLYRRGHAPEALGWLKRAYAGEPDPEVAAHLGEVQWAVGDASAAERTWREALERSPGERHLAEALERHIGHPK
jgi:Flp pilus assembly protein TadD